MSVKKQESDWTALKLKPMELGASLNQFQLLPTAA
jgi:hypothetical protein